jgi:nicotinamidase-related amidase
LCREAPELSEIALDLDATALVLVDITNGLLNADMFPHSAETVKKNSITLADAFREAGCFVVLTTAAQLAPAPEARYGAPPAQPFDRTADMAALAAKVGEATNPGQPPEDLGPKAGDHLIRKSTWSAFFQTDLDLQLRRRNVRTVVVGGIASNFGAESTARDAKYLGYAVVAVEDAMRAITAEEHEHSVRYTFPMIGRVRTTSDVLAAIR